MYRPISQQVQDTVASIILQDLEALFPEGIAFGPIEVEGEEFRDGDPFLKITIVYDGDLLSLDNARLLEIYRIRDKLIDVGIEEFPITYFSEKSAWESRKQGRKKIAGG